MILEQYFPGTLSESEVHVWHLAASEQQRDLLKYTNCLSAREKDRSNRLKLKKDHLSYVTRHVFLRKVLACYLAIDCNEIKFTENEYGKPLIDNSVNSQALQFSLSKSNDHVLLAIAQNQLIGCDIEHRSEILDYTAIISNFFSAQEIKFILHNSDQRTSFFDYWAAKEAYIKARGEGLSLPLDQFTLHIDNNGDVCMLENHVAPGDVEKWHTRRLKVAAGFSAAISIAGKISTLQLINVN